MRIKEITEEGKYRDLFAMILLAIIVISGIVNIFTYGTGIHPYDEPDFLENAMWAEAVLHSGKIVSDSFYYPYIIPFGSNLLALPFVIFFGTGLLANQLCMLVYFVIYLCSVLILARSLYDERADICLFISIVSAFVYTYAGINILHHLLYYGIAFVCFLGSLGCCINVINKKKERKYLFILLLWCLWAASNGITTFVLSNGALFVSVLVYCYLPKNGLNAFKEQLHLFVCILVSSLTGLIIYKIVTAGAHDLGGVGARFALTSSTRMIENLVLNFLNDYLRCFYAIGEGTSIFSIKGITILFRIFFALGVLLLSPGLTLRNFKKMSSSQLLCVLGCLMVGMICFAQYILTVSNERYLFNLMFSLLVILAINVIASKKEIEFRNLFTLAFVTCVVLFSLKNTYDLIGHGRTYQKKMEIIETLENEDLEYGFAKYNNVFNVLSGNKIKSLALDEFTNQKEMNNTEIEFYHEIPENMKEFFVIMPDFKYDIYLSSDPGFIKNHKKEIICNDYHILVFDGEYWNQIKEHAYSITK